MAVESSCSATYAGKEKFAGERENCVGILSAQGPVALTSGEESLNENPGTLGIVKPSVTPRLNSIRHQQQISSGRHLQHGENKGHKNARLPGAVRSADTSLSPVPSLPRISTTLRRSLAPAGFCHITHFVFRPLGAECGNCHHFDRSS